MNNEAEGNGEGGRGLPKPVIAAIVVVIVVIAVIVVMGQKEKFEPVGAGTVAPGFTLPDLEGTAVNLKDFRGKVVFLNFWATWCKPCEEEMPSMQQLYEDQEGRDFEIVAVSLDSEGPGVVREFVEKYGLTFVVLHDRRGRVKETYKTTGVPETFIIDQNGVIAEKVWGPRDWTREASINIILDLIQNGPRPAESYKRAKPHGS
jgi:peroxiredoxin